MLNLIPKSHNPQPRTKFSVPHDTGDKCLLFKLLIRRKTQIQKDVLSLFPQFSGMLTCLSSENILLLAFSNIRFDKPKPFFSPQLTITTQISLEAASEYKSLIPASSSCYSD